MILDDAGVPTTSAEDVEFGACVHVVDVATATLLAVQADVDGHHHLTLCGPGDFDCSAARDVLGWTADRGWL